MNLKMKLLIILILYLKMKGLLKNLNLRSVGTI